MCIIRCRSSATYLSISLSDLHRIWKLYNRSAVFSRSLLITYHEACDIQSPCLAQRFSFDLGRSNSTHTLYIKFTSYLLYILSTVLLLFQLSYLRLCESYFVNFTTSRSSVRCDLLMWVIFLYIKFFFTLNFVYNSLRRKVVDLICCSAHPLSVVLLCVHSSA